MRFIALVFMAWPLWAGPSILKLQAVYDKTDFFEARFKQTYWNKLFDRTETSEGRIAYQKPGKMRWDYLKPTPKYFILNNKTLWLVEPEEKVAYINRCFQSDALTASLVFLGGKGKLKNQFNTQASEKPDELILKPKIKNDFFERLILRVDLKTHRVLQSTLIDSDGNKNEFKFEHSRFNRRISKGQFEFKKSKNIELLDMPGGCSVQ